MTDAELKQYIDQKFAENQRETQALIKRESELISIELESQYKALNFAINAFFGVSFSVLSGFLIAAVIAKLMR